MNKSFKPVIILAVLAVFGVANAQEAAVGAVPASNHAPEASAVAEAPVPETPPGAAESALSTEAKSADSSTVVLVVEEPKKKKRGARAPKNEFAIVDVPANFEIQARKVMPVTEMVDSSSIRQGWGINNLDTWWGRANLMVLTESENFVGKVHLRMYPGQFYGTPTPIDTTSKTNRYGKQEVRDIFQLYEAWAWHRGDYVNIKIGRWDNTSRFGSKTFGGYVDSKKDHNYKKETNINYREKGFMSTYTPENALQFGLNNFSENISLDIALVSGDNHLNRGDLRAYFSFKDLAGLENMDIGLGYRSNLFDEIYDKRGDVTHTISLGFSMPIVKEAGILKSLNLFGEAALIGIDDQIGIVDRNDEGGSSECDFPILGGLDFSFHRGLDKIVIEAEYDGDRTATPASKVKDIQGSIYVQKKLNDRFTLNLGVQSENNTKDFSFAGRLQGRIN